MRLIRWIRNKLRRKKQVEWHTGLPDFLVDFFCEELRREVEWKMDWRKFGGTSGKTIEFRKYSPLPEKLEPEDVVNAQLDEGGDE